jgi:hypothetical protein
VKAPGKLLGPRRPARSEREAQNPEIILDTVSQQPVENALRIVAELIERDFYPLSMIDQRDETWRNY